jgi:hypothetical protein
MDYLVEVIQNEVKVSEPQNCSLIVLIDHDLLEQLVEDLGLLDREARQLVLWFEVGLDGLVYSLQK